MVNTANRRGRVRPRRLSGAGPASVRTRRASASVSVGPYSYDFTRIDGTSLQGLLAAEDSDAESFDSWRDYQEYMRTEQVVQPLPRYIWSIVKNTTRAERLSCAAAIFALLLCTSLIIYFSVVAKADIEEVDKAPHEWYITPEMWLSKPPTGNATVEEYSPLKLVIIQHTVSPECHRFAICAAELRNLQDYYLNAPHLGYDLAYNFAIGNEGRVYEVRGWNREGAHTRGYNKCSIGVAFIGDYREDLNVHTRVTDLQLARLKMLLDRGVELGFLRADYSILGAKDVADTYSPGENLYRAIQALDHYDTTNYRGLDCDQIHEMVNG